MQRSGGTRCQPKNMLMRKTGLFLLLFICLGSKAQKQKIELFAIAGANNTLEMLKMTGSSSTSSTGNWQWQTGVLLVLPVEKNWFAYTALQYENKSAHTEIPACCAGTAGENFDYKTHYINLPAGIGYQWALRKTKLRLGAGAFLSIATGGSMKGNEYGGNIITFSSMYPYRGKYVERKLKVGKAGDLSSTYSGMQADVSAVSKRWMLRLQYQVGWTKIAPDLVLKMYYNTASVSLGYRLTAD
jgi:hypothetical protein